jgi:hypothetical protein
MTCSGQLNPAAGVVAEVDGVRAQVNARRQALTWKSSRGALAP